jgi:ATP-dependent Clp protease, protease subunit
MTVLDNYKNVPQFLYGLSPAQMGMFMNDDNPYNRQSQNVTEVSDVPPYSSFYFFSMELIL